MTHDTTISNRPRRRRFALTLACAFVIMLATFVAGAMADAGNPILGTITGSIVTNPDGTVTVYVRGQWNWYSHGNDCNTDRAGTGVGIIWNDPTEPGYTVTKGIISAGVGIKTLRAGDTVNKLDQMVHPVDIGNVAEGYPGFSGQSFVDPSPPSPSSYASWKGGCGREPRTATASPGPGAAANPSGTPCADGTTSCSGRPWGSWGYQSALNDGNGQGYKHTFAKRSDVGTVCVNFYDVHGGGTGTKLQLVNGTKEITVNSNGDNSIQTNSFNVSQGANCLTFAQGTPTISTTASEPVTIGGSISDRATIGGLVSPDGTGTITFRAYAPKSDGTADTSCSTLVFTDVVTGISANGSYNSNGFTPSGVAPRTAGTYEWIASFSGDSSNAAVAGTCNAAGEQSVVNRQTTSVATGQKIQISDFAKPVGVGTPTGTVTFRLFTTANCSAAGLTYDSGPVTLVNGLAGTNTAATQPPAITADGTYYWQASYGGDDSNEASVSTCGAEQTSISGNTPGIAP